MNEDEWAALKWLQNGNDPLTREPQPGRAALVRLLKNSRPLNFDIRHALARALEPAYGGETRPGLVMGRRGGRGAPIKQGTTRGTIEDAMNDLGLRDVSHDTRERSRKRLRKASQPE
jgi:hypothetical protein